MRRAGGLETLEERRSAGVDSPWGQASRVVSGSTATGVGGMAAGGVDWIGIISLKFGSCSCNVPPLHHRMLVHHKMPIFTFLLFFALGCKSSDNFQFPCLPWYILCENLPDFPS